MTQDLERITIHLISQDDYARLCESGALREPGGFLQNLRRLVPRESPEQDLKQVIYVGPVVE